MIDIFQLIGVGKADAEGLSGGVRKGCLFY